MSVNQFIEERLSVEAKRVLVEAGERAKDFWSTATAYSRALQISRDFRRLRR